METLTIVNRCLRGIGKTKVMELEYPDADTEDAIDVVEEVRKHILSSGWWFNTEFGITMHPHEQDGRIEVPEALVGFRCTSVFDHQNIVRRDGKFYDMKNHTFDLRNRGDELEFCFYFDIAISDIPLAVVEYISTMAVFRFVRDKKKDALALQVDEASVNNAMAIAMKEQMRNLNASAYNSPKAQGLFAGILFSGAGNASGDPAYWGDGT